RGRPSCTFGSARLTLAEAEFFVVLGLRAGTNGLSYAAVQKRLGEPGSLTAFRSGANFDAIDHLSLRISVRSGHAGWMPGSCNLNTAMAAGLIRAAVQKVLRDTSSFDAPALQREFAAVDHLARREFGIQFGPAHAGMEAEFLVPGHGQRLSLKS